MSFEAISQALNLPPRVKGNTRLAAIAVANRVNIHPEHGDTPTCWPSLAGLAEDIGASKRSVQNALTALEDMRVITRVRRTNQDGRETTSLYRWHPWLIQDWDDDRMQDHEDRLRGYSRRAPQEAAQEPQERPVEAEVVEEPAPEPEASQKPSSDLVDTEPDREDVDTLCQHMADSVEYRTNRRPNITKGWRDSARLLLDRDHRPLDEAIHLITWATNDDFWRSNILSLPKLRQKYDTLLLQSQRTTSPSGDSQAAIARRLTAKSIRTSVQNGDMSPDKARRLAEAELHGTQADVWAILEEPDEDDWAVQALAALPPNYKEIYS